jgi:hypothetical protein
VEDMPDNLIAVEGKKLIWDGCDYTSGDDASRKMQTYKDDGFEVEAVEENGKTFLYTRRVVKEIIVQNV